MSIEKAIISARAKKEKGEDIPYQTVEEIGLDAAFKQKAEQFAEVSRIVAQAEEEKKALGEEIKRLLGTRNRDRVHVNDTLRLLCYEGKSVTIDQKKLLENGVSMDVIEASKNIKPYITVKTVKD